VSGPRPHSVVEGPLTDDAMADDTVAYLDGVVGVPAHLVGWSDGAVVALLMARRRPDLVDRLLLIGQNYNSPVSHRWPGRPARRGRRCA
jgi:pimeloyl-ACP methyl ester carboxylesterase